MGAAYEHAAGGGDADRRASRQADGAGQSAAWRGWAPSRLHTPLCVSDNADIAEITNPAMLVALIGNITGQSSSATDKPGEPSKGDDKKPK